jgi:hypothetical protein
MTSIKKLGLATLVALALAAGGLASFWWEATQPSTFIEDDEVLEVAGSRGLSIGRESA